MNRTTLLALLICLSQVATGPSYGGDIHSDSVFEEDFVQDYEETPSEEPEWGSVRADVIEIAPQAVKEERKYLTTFEVAHKVYEHVSQQNKASQANERQNDRAPASIPATPGTIGWTMHSAIDGGIVSPVRP